MESNQIGILLKEKDIKLHRKYFDELVRLIGVQVVYRYPKDSSKHYTLNSEVISNHYSTPQVVGCIFDDHPTQVTMKKLGWVAELGESAAIISVPYNLEGLQHGALFIIPSGIDNSSGRVFRVAELSVQMIYPASITCKLVPEYLNTFEDSQRDYKHSSFNLLNEGD